MKHEDKQLRLKDLCSRLPYGVIGRCKIDASYDTSYETVPQYHQFDAKLVGIKDGYLYVFPIIEDTDELECAIEEVADGIDIDEFTPYLRPLSSMTEEEDKEWQYYKNAIAENCDERLEERISELYDWFNANHFDYRGLIPKDLAIEVTKENNPYEYD